MMAMGTCHNTRYVLLRCAHSRSPCMLTRGTGHIRWYLLFRGARNVSQCMMAIWELATSSGSICLGALFCYTIVEFR